MTFQDLVESNLSAMDSRSKVASYKIGCALNTAENQRWLNSDHSVIEWEEISVDWIRFEYRVADRPHPALAPSTVFYEVSQYLSAIEAGEIAPARDRL